MPTACATPPGVHEPPETAVPPRFGDQIYPPVDFEEIILNAINGLPEPQRSEALEAHRQEKLKRETIERTSREAVDDFSRFLETLPTHRPLTPAELDTFLSEQEAMWAKLPPKLAGDLRREHERQLVEGLIGSLREPPEPQPGANASIIVRRMPRSRSARVRSASTTRKSTTRKTADPPPSSGDDPAPPASWQDGGGDGNCDHFISVGPGSRRARGSHDPLTAIGGGAR